MWVHRSSDNCPCKGCTERYLRCHGECERYKKWLANFQSEYKIYREQKDIANYDAHEAITGKRKNRDNSWKK